MAITISYGNISAQGILSYAPTVIPSDLSDLKYVAYFYDIITGGGGQPYSVTTGDGQFWDKDYAIEQVAFYVRRNSATRDTVITDLNYANGVTQYIDTVQMIDSDDYYSDYTFEIDGIVSLTPDFNPVSNPQVFDRATTPEYRLVSKTTGNAVGSPSTWGTGTNWTGLPLENCILQVRDEFVTPEEYNQFVGYFEMELVFDATTSPLSDFNRFEFTISQAQTDKNNKIGVVYNIEGVAPFSAGVYENWYEGNISNGPTIKFDLDRYTISDSLRDVRLFDANTRYNEHAIPYVQWVADDAAYDGNYTFVSDGTIVVTPNYKQYTFSVNAEFRIVDIQTGQSITAWLSTPSFEDIPLNDVYLEVRDAYGTNYRYILVYVPVLSLVEVNDVNDISFTNDPMVAVWDSGLKYGNNMKYKFIMFDDEGDPILRNSIYPDITNNNYGIYNMNMLYNDYVTTNITFKIDTGIVSDNVYDYTYNVNDQSSGDGVTSGTKYCIKGGTQYGDYFTFDSYIGEGRDDKKFLTKWYGDRVYRLDDYGVVNYLNGNFDGTLLTSEVRYIRFVKNGTGTTTYIPLGFDNLTFDNKLLQIPIAPLNYKLALDLNNVIDVDGNIITDNFMTDIDTTSYTVSLVDILFPFIYDKSEIINVSINKSEMCNKYDPIRFIWLDMYGNYNTFTFNGLSITNYIFNRNVINNDYYNLIDGEWTYNMGDRGLKNNDIRQREQNTATSGWIDDDMSKNLMGLFASSDVFIIKGGELYPTVVTSNGTTEKKIKNDRLFNYTIAYEMAYGINTND